MRTDNDIPARWSRLFKKKTFSWLLKSSRMINYIFFPLNWVSCTIEAQGFRVANEERAQRRGMIKVLRIHNLCDMNGLSLIKMFSIFHPRNGFFFGCDENTHKHNTLSAECLLLTLFHAMWNRYINQKKYCIRYCNTIL